MQEILPTFEQVESRPDSASLEFPGIPDVSEATLHVWLILYKKEFTLYHLPHSTCIINSC